MLQGETIRTGAPKRCFGCGHEFQMKVMKTNAWYIGTSCCEGANTRESEYYTTEEETREALHSNNVKWRK